MLAFAIVVGYAAGLGVGCALVTLAALPFRFMRWTREPLVASALACGALFALAASVSGVPDRLGPSIGLYALAFLVSFRFYEWRDGRLRRQVRTAVRLAGALPAGAADGSRKLDDLGGRPEVQL